MDTTNNPERLMLTCLVGYALAGCAAPDAPEMASLGISVQGVAATTELHLPPGIYDFAASGELVTASAAFYDLTVTGGDTNLTLNLTGGGEGLPGSVQIGDVASGGLTNVELSAGAQVELALPMKWNKPGQLDNAIDTTFTHVGAPELTAFVLAPAPYAKSSSTLSTQFAFIGAEGYEGDYDGVLAIGPNIERVVACDSPNACEASSLALSVPPGWYQVSAQVKTQQEPGSSGVAQGSSEKWLCVTSDSAATEQQRLQDCSDGAFQPLTATTCDDPTAIPPLFFFFFDGEFFRKWARENCFNAGCAVDLTVAPDGFSKLKCEAP